MNSLSPLSQFTADDTSAELFRQDFVPVQQMGFADLSFQKPSSTQSLVADDSSLPSKKHHLCLSPAQISSPFSSSGAAYTNTFVPMEIKADQIINDSSTNGDHADYDQHDLSAETSSSWDGENFAYDENPERKRMKKVGRPIAYKGDPNASNLTEAEKRRIKRRIANRESARRVRARRRGTLEELQVKMNHINAHNTEMVKHIAAVEGDTALLKGQFQQCEVHWNRAQADNARLHQQMALLTARIESQAPPLKREEQRPTEEAVFASHLMARAGSYNAAPVTGISCSLIDELPTMALPIPEMMSGPAWEGFDQEFSDYLV